MTAAHCVYPIEQSAAMVHPSLDLAVTSRASGGSSSVPLYLGDEVSDGLILAFETQDQGGQGGEPSTESPIGETVVEAGVELFEATETVLVARASDEGSSVCSGDSGSALLVESDGRLSLAGVLSSSSGSPGSWCTPDGGGEYWVRPSAALAWLEEVIGPCEPVTANSCTFASRDESTPPCVP